MTWRRHEREPSESWWLLSKAVEARADRLAGRKVAGFAPRSTLAREAGFSHARHIWGRSLAGQYFADRSDGLRPSSGEDFLLATT